MNKVFKKILSGSICVAIGLSTCVVSGCNNSSETDLLFNPWKTTNEVTADFSEAEYMEKGVLSDYPILVGGMAHGKEFIKAFNDLELGNFVWIPKQNYSLGNTDWSTENYGTDAEYAASLGMYYMASHTRGLGTEFKKGGFWSGGDTHAVTPTDANEIKKVNSSGVDSSGKNLFVGWHAEELDADLVQGSRLAFAARVPEVYNFDSESSARIAYEKELQRIQSVANNMGGYLISNQFVNHQLNAFRAGNEVIISELLEHGPNVELQLAYLRGGKNMFGNSWGVWVSPWYYGQVPAADTKLFGNTSASTTGGHKTLSYRHCVYESYVSGADIITNQETEPLIARDVVNGGYKDVLWGTELKNFWNYVKAYQESDIEPVNKTAVLIDRDNGWEVGRNWQNWYKQDTNWGKLSQTTANEMLAQYLNVLIPGYGRTVSQVQQGKDLYPGYFGSTPLGSFDIVASDISAERLSKYDNVIVMGAINMNDIINANLRSFVKGGGNLMMTAYQSMANGGFYEDPEFYGFTFQNFEGMKYSDRLCTSTTINKLVETEDDSLCYVGNTYTSDQFWSLLGVVGTADVLAVETGKNNPVLLCNKFGNGKVYLGLTEWNMDENNNMMDFYADVYRSIILNSDKEVMCLADSTNGLNDFSYQVSYRTQKNGKKQLIVLISSYATTDGRVKVNFNKFLDINKNNIHVEVCGGSGYDTFTTDETNGLSISLNIKAEDIALICVDDM